MSRWIIPAALVLVSACSDGDPTSSTGDDPVDDPRSATATPAGGTLEFLGGAVTLELPAGAVSSDVVITVDSVTSSVPANAVPGGVFRFGPSGLVFDEPVILTLKYPEDRIPDGFNWAALRLHDFTSGAPELLLGSLQDVVGATVSAEVHHFSVLGTGEASTDAVVKAINDLFSRVEEGRMMMLDRYREGLEADIALVAPELEAACVETNVLAEKLVYFQQLLGFEFIRDRFGMDSAVPPDSLCGGLTDADGSSTLEVLPQRATMPPGSTQQFSATMYGPGRQVLEGPVRFFSDDPTVLSVDSVTGFSSALEPGEVQLVALSRELPEIFLHSMTLLVFDSLEVVVEPAPLVVHYAGSQDVQATVVNTTTGQEQEGVSPVFEILDTNVADFVSPTNAGPGVAGVRGRSVGSTRLRVCAQLPEEISTTYCALPVVEVIPGVHGEWRFGESLEVDVDAPASETCTSQGTARIIQAGNTYTGTTEATITCTYDPGDGSDPEVFEETVTGELRNGTLNGAAFYHEIFYTDEACRSSGTLVQGVGIDSNLFVTGSGTTECLDDLDFYSNGPLSFRRPGYDTSPGR